MRRVLATIVLLAGCAHQLPDSEPQRLREWRDGRVLRRSLDGVTVTEADEAQGLAAVPRAAQAEAQSHRLYAGGLAAIFGGFALGLAAVPLALELRGRSQVGVATGMALAPIGAIVGYLLDREARRVHRNAIVWFNRAAREPPTQP